MSEELFREVDEEVRQDRYQQLLKRYGVYVGALALIIIVVVVAVVVWRDIQQGAREADGEAFLAAVEISERQRDAALEQLSTLAAESTDGYRLLARLREGALLARRGDTRGAVAVYDAIAADDDQDQIYRDLASILAAAHGMTVMDRSEVEQRLRPIAADGNPWRYSARELLAIAAMAAGDTASARAGFEALIDDLEAPRGIRARSAEMLAALSD